MFSIDLSVANDMLLTYLELQIKIYCKLLLTDIMRKPSFEMLFIMYRDHSYQNIMISFMINYHT